MNRTTLHALLGARDLTIEQLQAKDPALAAEVLASVRRAEGARLKDALGDMPEHVRTKVEEIDFTAAIGNFFEHIRLRISELGAEDEHARKVVERASKVKVGQGLRPGQIIGTHPALATLIATARVNEVSTVAGLHGAPADALAQAAPAPSALDEATLTRLVSETKLSDEQARNVGLSVALYQLAGEDTKLASAIRSASFPALGGRSPASTTDLARVTVAEWTSFFTSTSAALPAGATPEQMSAVMAARFAAIHPGVAMTGRLPQPAASEVTSAIQDLAPLFQRNPKVAGVGFADLVTTGLDAAEVAKLQTTQVQLAKLAAAYPGLELASILDDPALDPTVKAETVTRRLGLVQKVSEQLDQSPVLHFDLSAGSPDLARLNLAGLGATADEERMVVSTLQAYQRVWTVAKNVDDVHTLVANGFRSATAMGTLPFNTFLAKSGFSPAEARNHWESARTSMADVMLAASSGIDAINGMFSKLPVGNQSPAAEEYLKKLPGFEDLFGSLSFCDCEECQSILGPAAYFVDLMKYIDENLRPLFAKHPNHPLDLKVRRPDLWTLELSCKNTSERIPTLEIIHEILEGYIAQQLDGKVYEKLATVAGSFHAPFHLPLTRINAYLAKLEHTRAEVASAVGASATERAQAELGLSVREFGLVITPRDLPALEAIYDMTFAGTPAKIDALNVQTLIFSGPASDGSAVDAKVHGSAVDLSREEMGQLVKTHFVSAGGASVKIIVKKSSAKNSVQNDVELVTGLTVDALDRMHRFTRLVRKTGWSIPELDLVLGLVLGALEDPKLEAAASVEAVAELHALQARFEITVAEQCALAFVTPWTPKDGSFFDRLFNSPAFPADGAFPSPTTQFVHPVFGQSKSAPDSTLPRLLSGLSVDLRGLETLCRRLALHLAQEASPSFDPGAATEADRYFVLSVENLILLYRHARLARLLGVSIDDLFQMLGLIDLEHIEDLADLRALVDFHAWWQGSGYRLDDVAVATGQAPRDPSRYVDAASAAAQVVASAAGLTFKDTVFAVALGTTEQGSRDLLAANAPTENKPGVVESLEDGTWRLVAGVDSNDVNNVILTIPETVTKANPPSGTLPVTDADVRKALRPYLAREVIVSSLGTAFGLATDKVAVLAAIAGQSLTSEVMVKAVRENGAITPLIDLISSVRPLAVTFSASVWDEAAIEFAQLNPKLFGTEALPQTTADEQHPNIPFVSLAQLRALFTYSRLASRRLAALSGGAPGDEKKAVQADLQGVLSLFDAAGDFPLDSDATMASVLGVPIGLVVGLRGRVTLPVVAAAALEQLDRAAQLAVAIGIDGETLGGLVVDNDDPPSYASYDTLAHAADALFAALGSRYSDEKTRASKLDEAEQPLREAKRDALADYLIHSFKDPKGKQIWSRLDDLYEYFLIDVEAGGCSTTSRVVAATMSAQLYVYRAIMNLEQSASGDVALSMPADAAEEWEWRRNYRVWQANRKVFLWPENYLDPDLRDDKTPLFKELEQELLQTDIDDQSVLDAYTKYLAGFEEVASLVVAGAYHDVRTRGDLAPGQVGDILHLFGAAANDPPIYYYRTCENLIASARDSDIAAVWSPWQKITVQITGRKVSPVVHMGRLHVFWIDIKSRPVNRVKEGASKFVGYRHQMSLKFTTLRPDGTWTVPQQIQLPDDRTPYFGPGRGQVEDLLDESDRAPLDPYQRQQLDPLDSTQTEPIDDYTLSGPNWEWVWPRSVFSKYMNKLLIQFRNFAGFSEIDLFGRAALSYSLALANAPAKYLVGYGKDLYSGIPTNPIIFGTTSGFANAIIDEQRMEDIDLEKIYRKSDFQSKFSQGEHIATIPSDTQILAIPGSEEDALLQVGNDVLLLQGSVTDNADYILRRLGTTLIEDIARRLFEDGLDGLLDTQTQYALAEAKLPITRVNDRIDMTFFNGPGAPKFPNGKLDFDGPYGVYYREIFFHIPFLLANALNSRGRFGAAQRWYHYIFDPTSTEQIAWIDLLGLPPDEKAHRMLDRVWRYREFRGQDLEHLRDVLTDKTVLARYKQDPFNPWAIARGRISAFQKAIVMKYIDNLIDWGDALFTQFTMESVNEAMMLYIMASDLLGRRPAELGDCGAGIEPTTYAKIGPLIDTSSEMLIETWVTGSRVSKAPSASSARKAPKYAIDHIAAAHAIQRHPFVIGPPHEAAHGGSVNPALTPVAAPPVVERGMFRGLGGNATRTASWGPALGNSTIKTKDKVGGRSYKHAKKGTRDFSSSAAGFGWSIFRQIKPVFCVPVNADLLAYWDRVGDRLYKIRNCMDIDGQKRELALFAPPIDPMQLVAMKAAGLSLDDVLGATSGNLPPYRFAYLIERAKALAAGLNGFGAALLSALEKKDGEELNRLRLTQQLNLTRMTSHTRQLEINAASESLEALNGQLASAQHRSDFYAGLIDEERNLWEKTESALRHVTSSMYVVESVLDTVSAVLSTIPQVGSPLAMKYGGVELSSSVQRFGNAFNSIASGFSAISASMSLEGNFTRRREGWGEQKTLADHDIKALRRQVKAAEIHLDIANRALDLHQKSIDQMDEFLERNDGKFTNHGLYTWISQKLQSTYRGAYQNALAMMKLAEQAYRFERGEDATPKLGMAYWNPTYAGFLAGEQMLVDLQTMERRFIETNYRTLEVEQSFALTQLDPAQLLTLRESGSCTFSIPELFFDLAYPGHYRRQIKAVRVTIPCVTGPYTNVGATLTLQNSKMRAKALDKDLTAVPLQRTVSIATSRAQNDAGVFELSFHDERYMPFEGAGAVSTWKLELPASFRPFDYQTISDVVLTINYTALADGGLRQKVEDANSQAQMAIAKYLTNPPADHPLGRVFSMRQEFPMAYKGLLASPPGTAVSFEILDWHFPAFMVLAGKTLKVTSAKLALKTGDGVKLADLSNVWITVDGLPAQPKPPPPPVEFAAGLGGLPTTDIGAGFTSALGKHTLMVKAAGKLAPVKPAVGDLSAIDGQKLLDVLLYVEYYLK